MTIEFDDNGKFFTDIISKAPIPVMIQTITHRIHGYLHVSQGKRLIDELDLPERFLAITDAVIYLSDGQVAFQAKFLSIQREEIIWVIPDSEITDKTGESVK